MSRSFPTSFGLLLAGTIPLVAYSQVYMTEDQASQSMLPGEVSARKTFELSADEMKKIEKKSDEKVRNSSVVAWVTPKKNLVFIDQVLGKHEFITYAVAVSKSGKVTGIEILEYRETYGQGVRDAAWRKQFVDKDAASPLHLKTDIVNISGATLSSAHITGGVRRLLQTYEIIRTRL
jgi:Na+-translocating ferredoxin:NAD+ oxidoreductase RnfG subunit